MPLEIDRYREITITDLGTPEGLRISFYYGKASDLTLFRRLERFDKRIFTTVYRNLTIFYYMEDNEINIYSSIEAGTRKRTFFSFLSYFIMRGLFPPKIDYMIAIELEKSPENEEFLMKQLKKIPKKTYYHRDRIENEILAKGFNITREMAYMFLP